MKYVFFLDFDGTITVEDTCDMLLKRYGNQESLALNRRWERKEIATRECARLLFRQMDLTPAALSQLVGEVELDPGFKALLGFCEQRGYPVFILSDGYDQIIQGVIQRENIQIPFYCNNLVFDGDYTVSFPNHNPDCGQCGTCKRKLIEQRSSPGTQGVYVGDGYSDFCAAATCEVVFAKGKLWDYCRAKNIPAYPYETFLDVLQWLRGGALTEHPV